jgi:hypothetical protein
LAEIEAYNSSHGGENASIQRIKCLECISQGFKGFRARHWRFKESQAKFDTEDNKSTDEHTCGEIKADIGNVMFCNRGVGRYLRSP